MNLIGLDVGFSATRRSSGVARLSGADIAVGCATASWESRKAFCSVYEVDVAAIDAPVLASETYDKRACEHVFTLGSFQRRCKPGLSHISGTGRKFRDAGQDSALQLSQITSQRELVVEFPRAWKEKNIVEAFPNAFLGVLLPIKCFDRLVKMRRGTKFDWLYEQFLQEGNLETVVKVIGRSIVNSILSKIRENKNHDQRAALICLLTAAAVVTGRYTAVGNEAGGYFFLPPWERWTSWAREELDKQRRRAESVEVWISGTRYSHSKTLP